MEWEQFTSPPLVSSQRPNTELAAARTEQREFSVVVIPAFCTYLVNIAHSTSCTDLSNGNGLLLHGLMYGYSIILSHLPQTVAFHFKTQFHVTY